jgi:hypothetical protein
MTQSDVYTEDSRLVMYLYSSTLLDFFLNITKLRKGVSTQIATQIQNFYIQLLKSISTLETGRYLFCAEARKLYFNVLSFLITI